MSCGPGAVDPAASDGSVAFADGEDHAGADAGHARHQHAEHQELLPPTAIAGIDRLASTARLRQRADALVHAALDVEIHVLLGRLRRDRGHDGLDRPDGEDDPRQHDPDPTGTTTHASIVT